MSTNNIDGGERSTEEWTRSRIQEDPDDDWEPPYPGYAQTSVIEDGQCIIWTPHPAGDGDVGAEAWITSDWYITPMPLDADTIDDRLPQHTHRPAPDEAEAEVEPEPEDEDEEDEDGGRGLGGVP